MNAIEVRDVTKKFKVYYDKGRSFKEKLLFQNRNKYEERLVLKGISFDVKKGEAIGLIGENGCGKSTLLKLMTRILYPDSGNLTMHGRVSSLIELGAGFHPDMSGRENIYTNASIFGLTRKEIDARLQKIIDFSELWEFIDNPVRTYSSGMYMRLAFAVAINVDADILLIDEILAVGDANFQAKCFNKLREIKAAGTTIVIVSHSLGQIEQICERSIWINQGIIKKQGNPRNVHPYYMEFMGSKQEKPAHDAKQDASADVVSEDTQQGAPQDNEQNKTKKTRWGSRLAVIKNISSFDAQGKESKRFRTGEPVMLRIDYLTEARIEDAVFGVGIIRNDGFYCYGTNTTIDRVGDIHIEGRGSMEMRFEKLNLLPGIYELDIAIEKFPGIPLDFYRKAYIIEVYSEIGDVGAIRLDHNWKWTQL